MTFDDIKNQLERYGGEPHLALIPVLTEIAELNDDMQHLRSIDCISECIEKIKRQLDKLQAEYL